MPHGAYLRSGSTLGLARAAYQRSLDDAREAEVAITLSAAAFEGFLNDLAFALRTWTQPDYVVAAADVLAEAEEARLQPVIKYRLAMYALSGRFPRKGDLEVQRLASLVKLRNNLLHIKPEPIFTLDDENPRFDGTDRPPSEVQFLISQGVVVLPPKYGGSWRALITSSAVADWSYRTSVAAMKHIAATPQDATVKGFFAFFINGVPDDPNAA